MNTATVRTILLAPDKFKGSLTAAEVCDALIAGIRRDGDSPRMIRCPIADGGDGTVEAALAAGFEERSVTVTGPTGGPLQARFALRGTDAVLELAETSGLRVLPGGTLDHDRATTRGLGEMILAARDAGARRILVGIGGSSSTDLGMGMLSALGARFTDAGGTEIGDGAAALADLAAADLASAVHALRDVDLVAACDVTNPLNGPEGAAAVYGPQKGLAADRIETIDRHLADAAALIDPGGDLAEQPGAGAAGGAGFALYALGATFASGADAVLDLLGFDASLAEADLVITGEGKLDAQTLHGKGPAEVARRAAAAGIPVFAVAGGVSLTPDQLAEIGVRTSYDLISRAEGLPDAIARGAEILEGIGREIGREIAEATSRPS